MVLHASSGTGVVVYSAGVLTVGVVLGADEIWNSLTLSVNV